MALQGIVRKMFPLQKRGVRGDLISVILQCNKIELCRYERAGNKGIREEWVEV